MSTAPIFTIPFKIYAAFSIYGADILQCPHQGAKLIMFYHRTQPTIIIMNLKPETWNSFKSTLQLLNRHWTMRN